jgi:hypothetical protein
MKALTTTLPVGPTPDMALAIIDQLGQEAFAVVAEGVKERARARACATWNQMRRAARQGGLRKPDFLQAIAEVRGRRRARRASPVRRP